MASATPRYRIHAVAEMTGIPASTLRAWERRYGIPAPQRTSSSYRLYSDDDVGLVRRLRELCDAGVAPSEAARCLLQRGQEPSEEPRQAAGPFEEAVSRILSAVEAFDPDGLRMETARATYLGCASAVFEHVIGPTMRAVGQGWHEGRLSVAQEHMASEILLGTARDMHRLLQPEGADRVVVLACVAGEFHALPLYGVAFRFASWGWRSELLGADTPPEAIADAVGALGPHAVGLSMTTSRPVADLARLLDAYARAIGGRPWVLGGVGSEHHRALVEGRGGLVAGEDVLSVRAPLEQAVLMACKRGMEACGCPEGELEQGEDVA